MFKISLEVLRNHWHEEAYEDGWYRLGDLDVYYYNTSSASYLVAKPAGKKPTKTNLRVLSGHSVRTRMWEMDRNGNPINGRWSTEWIYPRKTLDLVKFR